MKQYPRPAPPIPEKFRNNAEFGAAVGWGTYDADAKSRARTITRHEVIVELEMTAEIAEAWIQRYQEELDFNPLNPSARGRIELMRRIIELLED
jgi:hypothetical protein